MRFRLPVMTLIVVLSIGSVAWAQQTTGSVSGAVFDQTGAVLQDAAVRISGENLPAGRTTRTSDSGLYNFPLLIPGTYAVEAEVSGLGKTSRVVEVQVGRDTQVDITIGVAGLQEQLTVTAATPEVDLKSTEVAFNYGREEIQALPLQRSYAGLLQLIPGVADNGAFAPNAGASRQDNTYLLDGVNITNPLFGYLSTEVNEFDIVEFNVKKGAVSAEFGRSNGAVTNAVTRSGTNQLRGGVRFEMIPNNWIAEAKSGLPNTQDRWIPAYMLGGPALKDRLFWYTSGMFSRAETHGRVNNLGPVPDRVETTKDFFGKLTAQLGNTNQFNMGYRARPSTCEFCSIGVNSAPEVGTNNEGTNRVVTVAWNWFPTSRTVLDVKYLRMDEETEQVAITQFPFQPTFDVNNLAQMGQYTAGGITRGGDALALNRQNYKRDEIKATLTQYFDSPGMNHQFKVGFGFENSNEDLTRESNGWGIVTPISGNRYQALYYPTQPAQIGIGETYSLFVQDDISIGDRLVINAGVLFNKDDFSQETDEKRTFVSFGFGDEFQPRLGFNYRLREETGDKIYANYGRYYSLDQKSTARSLAPRRLFQSEAVFSSTGQLISDTPASNTVSKVIDNNLQPPFQDEFIVGYATPLGGFWSMDAFFQYRDADDFIEDIPSVLPNSSYIYINDSAADRKYRALVFELNRRTANNWTMNVSYSFSKLYGNYDLDYSGGVAGAAVFNTSSLINDGPGSFTADTFRQGVLSQDRPHVLKVFASYLPPQISGLTVGGYLRAQSGKPWEARGLPWGSTLTYLRYLEPAGTNRTDFWTNFDFLMGYVHGFGRFNARVEGRILNLFNNQTELAVDQRQYLDPRNRTIVGSPDRSCLACWTDAMVQGTSQPNPRYGEPTDYASPRRFLLTLQLDF
ncbi:MAG TPA: TonB-dependent receptor [Vicinamibacterales bacterium]|nr:TonB-dependent receptor [Vicinamibacterales bacterium]